uniref:Uncharacterized protein n=1 Tax=Arundo donax TaxID=35708 RepID=A0A0A9BEE6_ARUDO
MSHRQAARGCGRGSASSDYRCPS